MLRPQVQRDVEEDAEDLERGKLDAGGADSALKTHEKERKQSEEAFLWLLLLAAVAECVTTCFVPGYSMAVWGVNVGATALNWLGPFMDGVSYGLEDRFKGVEVSLACIQFRSAFLGVFTSYSFMTDHAGDLSSSSFAAGPLYVREDESDVGWGEE
ncbi:hypothetical protein PHYBOEH_005274 [Phytophthora boehmeriae]|uniref:Uncharacterized protein n=1 Tax=Phytophthora boehmeriae TaxID=109152 RepID=A0A8T1WPV3_9STRA|nr:hypothetical protein PHYBOEH_005274 [Phytophthora boehmeriae]